MSKKKSRRARREAGTGTKPAPASRHALPVTARLVAHAREATDAIADGEFLLSDADRLAIQLQTLCATVVVVADSLRAGEACDRLVSRVEAIARGVMDAARENV